MVNRDKIQVELIKLDNGERLLRLTDLPSGLALEKKVDSRKPIVGQKERLFSVFAAALTQAEINAA